MRAPILLAALLTLVGCPDDPTERTVGKRVDYEGPPIPDLTDSGLPEAPNGNVVVFAIPGVQLELDMTRKNAVTGFGRCVEWVVTCVAPDARSLDDCFFSVPKCSTDEPWNEAQVCCPEACFTRYASARLDEGREPLPAFEQVMFDDKTCFPGMMALLGGGS